ncbi:hypothetical protein M2366_001032 [Aeromonas sp. BIGb0405]|jgi:hypothetical protein|nr:hypothetical protein [Aeromonas sp. BIGb0405]
MRSFQALPRDHCKAGARLITTRLLSGIVKKSPPIAMPDYNRCALLV